MEVEDGVVLIPGLAVSLYFLLGLWVHNWPLGFCRTLHVALAATLRGPLSGAQ